MNLNQGQSSKFYNQYTLKKFNENYYKLVLFKFAVNRSGYEKSDNHIPKKRIDDMEFEKEECNLSRVRSKIFEYALCNEFDYFITLTLNKDKMDRYDLQNYIKKLGQFIRDERKRTNKEILYLLIPEKHQDGAYHMHGLVKGISEKDLKLFGLDDNIPQLIKALLNRGRKIYDWLPYSKKFGWVTVEKITNPLAISKYITKYVKKDIGTTVTEINKKSYYCSKGLKQAEIIKKGTLSVDDKVLFNFENDYIRIAELDKSAYENLILNDYYFEKN